MYAADVALVVVSATSGVEVGTEKVWEFAAERNMPRMLFVSLMDKEHANFEKVFADIRDRITPKVVPIEVPVGDGPEFHGIINLFSKKCHMYKKGTKTGEFEEVDIPSEYQEIFEKYSEVLAENVAEVDDELIERYLEGEEIRSAEAMAADREGMAAGDIYPVLGWSGTRT